MARSATRCGSSSLFSNFSHSITQPSPVCLQKKKKKKFKKGEVNPDFVRPDISKVEAQKRINRQCVVKASYNEVRVCYLFSGLRPYSWMH